MSRHVPLLGRTAVAILAAVAWQSASAQASPSLGEARLGVIKGTSPGITLVGRNPASAPQASESGASAPAGAAKTPTQRQAQTAMSSDAGTATSPQTGSGWGALLRSLPPPQGDGMSSAKRLESPSLGIALPTAASAPAKAEDRPAPKPAPVAR